MSAPEKSHTTVAVHPGSEFAIKDANVGWQKIHRVTHYLQLSKQRRCYIAACCLHIESNLEATPLSSGHLGKRCTECWKHLPTFDRDPS